MVSSPFLQKGTRTTLMNLYITLPLLAAALFVPTLAGAMIVTNTNDSGPGSLRQAILDANANAGLESIDFNLGGAAAITLNSTIAITDDLKINGPGSSLLTIEMGAGQSERLFFSNFANFELGNCTLRGGSPSGSGENGGAIRFAGGQGTEILSLNNVVFLNNTATTPNGTGGCGGALYVESGHLSVSGCRFENNNATNAGGAICIRPNVFAASPSYLMTQCTFRNNSCGSRGGAVDVLEGSDPQFLVGNQLTFTSCAFVDNTVEGTGFLDVQGGGALRVECTTAIGVRQILPLLTGCHFENNRALAATVVPGPNALGGAVLLTGGEAANGGDDDIVQATVDSCTFTGNEAQIDGGAWFLRGTTKVDSSDKTRVQFVNSTLHGNVGGVAVPQPNSGTFGGGLAAILADVEFDSCTVTENLGLGDTGNGTGVVGGMDVLSGNLLLANTIVADNVGTPGQLQNADEIRWGTVGQGPFFNSDGSNLVRGSVDGVIFKPGDLTGIDSFLTALLGSSVSTGAANDAVPLAVRTPLPGSPVIDVGITQLAVDQVGTARPVGSGPDIGAIEKLPAPELIITEIMYDPAGPEPAWEWVELYNFGAKVVDLSGLVLDNGDSVGLASPNILSGIVLPGETAVLYNASAISAVGFRAAWGAGVPLVPVSPWAPLANTGGRVGLWESIGAYLNDHQLHTRTFDTVAYDFFNSGFPTPANGESIFLVDLNLDNSLPSSWDVSSAATLPPTPLTNTYQSSNNNGNGGQDYGSPHQGNPLRDWGDLPDTSVSTDTDYPTRAIHNGPSHVIVSELRIGTELDPEPDGQPSLNAEGDDLASPDDEDGVTLPPSPLTNGESATFEIAVTNTTGTDAFLYAFFDWNGDDDFEDADEAFVQGIPNGTVNATVNFVVPVPSNALTQTNLGARFRLSTWQALTALGPAPDGEVEDYLVQTMGIDWGDLPDLGPGTGPGDYQTLAANGGPSHVISPLLLLSYRPDDHPDAEADGQPTAIADGDDTNGDDDENQPPFSHTLDPVTGEITLHIFNAFAVNNLPVDATLYAFLDINGDGDFDDPDESETGLIPGGPGVFVPPVFHFTIPLPFLSLGENTKFVRFRLSTDSSLSPNGPAPDGEVNGHCYRFSLDFDSSVIDFGDLPDVALNPGSLAATPAPLITPAGTEPYFTLVANNGPVHIQTAGLTLGTYVADGEADGQPSAAADGDDLDGIDDENGVAIPSSPVLGTNVQFVATATNNSGVPAYLLAFVDWDGDRAFNFTDERAAPVLVPDGSTDLAVPLVFPVPIDSATGKPVGVRFRLVLDPTLGPNGPAGMGEVEDYMLTVQTDSDGDGLEDRFELRHFGDLNTANANTDTDQDGSSDEEEEESGTDPNDPNSPSGGMGPFLRTGDLIAADSGNNTLLRIDSNGAVSQLLDPASVDIPGFSPDFASTNIVVVPTTIDGAVIPFTIREAVIPFTLREAVIPFTLRDIRSSVEVYFVANSDNGPVLAHLDRNGEVHPVATAAEIQADTGLSPVALKGLALGSNRKIYALEANSNSVLRIDPETGTSTIFTSAAAINALPEVDSFTVGVGLLALPAGELALVDTDSDTLLRLGFDGTPTLLADDPLITDLTPTSFLTRLPGGDLLVVDRSPDEVLRVRLDGTVSVFLSNTALRSTLGGPPDVHSIAADSEGRLSLINRDALGGFAIWSFDPDGRRGEEVVGSAHLTAVLPMDPVMSGGAAFAPAPIGCDFPDFTHVIVRSGDPVPFVGGQFAQFGVTESTDLNNEGAIAFGAVLSGTPGGALQDQGIFLANENGVISPILVEGNAVPEGGNFDRFQTFFRFVGATDFGEVELNDAGEVAFWGGLRNTAAREAIFLWDGTLHELTREGDLLEGVAPVLDVQSKLELNELGQVAYRANLGAIGEDVILLQSTTALEAVASKNPILSGTGFRSLGTPDLNNLGQTALDGDYHLDTSSFLGPFGGTTARSIRLVHDGSSVRIAREDTTSVPTGLDQLGRPALNDLAEVAFRARRINPFLGEALFLHTGGVNVEIARQDNATPDGNHYYGAFGDPQLNNDAQVAFVASIHTHPSDLGPIGEGLFLRSGFSTQEVARTGQATPGGATFLSIRDFRLGGSGLAFVAEVDASALGMRASELGLYVFAGGELLEIIQSGRPFEGETVASLELVGINDSLQVAYTLALPGSTFALCRTDLARALHYRPSTSGSWDVAGNWTLGVAPHEESAVCIDPAVGLTVTGPADNVTVHSLRVDASGSNPANLRLQSSGILTTLNGSDFGPRSRLTGAGTLSGLVRGARGSVIAPDGDMALGDPSGPWAFSSAGTIRVGPHVLSLDSRDPVQLFGLTEMQGGTLTAWSDVANSGTLRGDGLVDGTVFNAGEVRAATGERLMLWGLDNAAMVDVFGGEFEVIAPALNDGTGEINCRNALLRFDSGLSNEGLLAFSFGTSDVFGLVENTGASRVIVSGQSNATFWDEVLIGGADFRISGGSTAVFLGDVSGPGFITGTGSSLFEATYSPGDSPASVSIGGDVTFSFSSVLLMELGGTVLGTEHDHLDIGGTLDLQGGTLRVDLIDGFVPSAGDRFDLFEFGALLGTFGSLDLSALPTGLFWNTSPLYTTGEIIVSCVPESFARWQDAFFAPAELLDPALSGFAADIDLDGLANGLEYLLGSDPRTTSSDRSPVPAPDGTGSRLELTFVMPELPGADLMIEVQASTTLAPGSWRAIATKSGTAPWGGAATVTVVPLGGGKVQVTIEDPALISDGPRRFLRVAASLAP